MRCERRCRGSCGCRASSQWEAGRLQRVHILWGNAGQDATGDRATCDRVVFVSRLPPIVTPAGATSDSCCVSCVCSSRFCSLIYWRILCLIARLNYSATVHTVVINWSVERIRRMLRTLPGPLPLLCYRTVLAAGSTALVWRAGGGESRSGNPAIIRSLL